MFFMNFLLWYGCPDYWHQNAWTEVEVWIWSTWPDSHNRGKPSVFLVSILKLAFKVVDLITKLLPFWGLESVRFEWPYPELICCFCSCKLWPNSHSSDLNVSLQQRLPFCWCAIYFSFSIFLNSWVPIYRYIMEMFWKIHSLATKLGKQWQQGLLQNLMSQMAIGRALSGSYQSDLKWLQVKYTTSRKLCEWLKYWLFCETYMKKDGLNWRPIFVS